MRHPSRANFRAQSFHRVVVGLAVSVVLSACQDQSTLPPAENKPAAEVRTFTFAELAARMGQATNVSAEALSPRSAEVFSARFSKTFGNGSEQTSGRVPFTAEELASLAGQVVNENPDAFDPSERDLVRISRDLGGLSRAEVLQNIGTIRKLYDAKLRYEVLARMEQTATTSSGTDAIRVPNRPSFVTICEAWYVANFPARSYDTKQAADYATARAYAIYGTNADGVRANAFKHAFWNAIIPIYTGKYFSSVADAMDWAKRITDAHECGSEALSKAMDLHNNAQGRSFIQPYLWVNVTWYNSRSVKGPDLTFIESQMKYRASKAVFVTSAAQMDWYPSSLVYLVR